MAFSEISPIDWSAPIVDPKTGRPTLQFIQLWQQMFTSGEATDTEVDTKVASTRQVISGDGLTGGGDLSADRTLSVGAGTGITVSADTVSVDTVTEAERIRDVIAAALQAGANITVTVDDGADTITIASTGAAGGMPTGGTTGQIIVKLSATDYDATWSDLDATLTALSALDGTSGLVEQTGVDVFTKRAIGTGTAASVLTRADGDGRYALVAHTHIIADVTGLQAALDGKQPLDATLTDLASRNIGAASATDILDRAAGDGRYALTGSGVTSFNGRTGAVTLISADVTSALGYTPQQQDTELTALAGLASAADRVPYFTGSGTASLATFTAFGRSLVDDVDAAAARTTLGLGTMATQAAASYAALAGAAFTGGISVAANISTTVGSGGTITAFDNDAVRANRAILGADASGAYIQGTFSSGGTGDVRVRVIGTDIATFSSTGLSVSGTGTFSGALSAASLSSSGITVSGDIFVTNSGLINNRRYLYFQSGAGVYDASISVLAVNGNMDFSVGRSAAWGGDFSWTVDTTQVMTLTNTGGLNLAATGRFKINGTQVVTSRRTGWGAPTGTATRTSFDTSTATTTQLAERVKALIDDLTTHGLIGA